MGARSRPGTGRDPRAVATWVKLRVKSQLVEARRSRL